MQASTNKGCHFGQDHTFKKTDCLRVILRLLFKFLQLPLVIETFLVLHCLFVFQSRLILAKKALCFVVHKITEDLEAVALLDGFLLKQLGYHGDTLPNVLELGVSFLDLTLHFHDGSVDLL